MSFISYQHRNEIKPILFQSNNTYLSFLLKNHTILLYNINEKREKVQKMLYSPRNLLLLVTSNQNKAA